MTKIRSVISNFFFQAEDGIRAFHVTGVQTCALPISRALRHERDGGSVRGRAPDPRHRLGRGRSEERRVGKECRARRSPNKQTTKNNNTIHGSTATRPTAHTSAKNSPTDAVITLATSG